MAVAVTVGVKVAVGGGSVVAVSVEKGVELAVVGTRRIHPLTIKGKKRKNHQNLRMTK
jgi:serine acetyltransferase